MYLQAVGTVNPDQLASQKPADQDLLFSKQDIRGLLELKLHDIPVVLKTNFLAQRTFMKVTALYI